MHLNPEACILWPAMRKEVLIAIILGLILGSILVYGIYTANQASSTYTDSPTEETNQNQTENSQSNNQALTVSSPQDGDIFYTPQATISGQTDPQNALVIITEDDHLVPDINEDGSFSQSVTLIRGGNLIQVTSMTPSGQRQDSYLNLVYTSPPAESDSDDNTQSDDEN